MNVFKSLKEVKRTINILIKYDNKLRQRNVSQANEENKELAGGIRRTLALRE